MTEHVGEAVFPAHRLYLVLGRLVRRLRSEPAGSEIPLAQMLVLSRLERDGANSATGLAAAERVRIQSMMATIGNLESRGLVNRTRDSRDRRQFLITLTAAGREFIQSVSGSREAWLTKAVASCIDAEGQAILIQALELLDRLAECEVEASSVN